MRPGTGDRIVPEGIARLENATLSYGNDGGKPFIHCHGIWRHAGGHLGGGHLIPEDTGLAEDVVATAWIVSGAFLDRQADTETNFPLPTPVAEGSPDLASKCAALLRIKPNMDIHLAIEAAAREHGIDNGTIHGVCSLVSCDFAGWAAHGVFRVPKPLSTGA